MTKKNKEKSDCNNMDLIINHIIEHEDKLIVSKTKELKKDIKVYKIRDFIK